MDLINQLIMLNIQISDCMRHMYYVNLFVDLCAAYVARRERKLRFDTMKEYWHTLHTRRTQGEYIINSI